MVRLFRAIIMKKFLFFLLGVIAGLGAGGYLTLSNLEYFSSLDFQQLVSRVPLFSYQREELAKQLGQNLSINGGDFIDAAIQVEKGNSENFDLVLFELGKELNESIEQTLELSPEAKAEMEVLLTNSRKTALVNYVFSFGFLKGRKPLTPRSGFVLKEYFPNRLIWANGAGEINSKSFSSIGYPSWCNSLIISCI